MNWLDKADPIEREAPDLPAPGQISQYMTPRYDTGHDMTRIRYHDRQLALLKRNSGSHSALDDIRTRYDIRTWHDVMPPPAPKPLAPSPAPRSRPATKPTSTPHTVWERGGWGEGGGGALSRSHGIGGGKEPLWAWACLNPERFTA